jgi:hypothetical protein
MRRNASVCSRPGHYYDALRRFVTAAHIIDQHGAPLPLTRTHQFRHTVATNFANAGVPVHVLQRFLGHSTPTMSMHYVAIRDETAEQAFLNLVKIGANGDEVAMDRTSMYDLLQLHRSTDQCHRGISARRRLDASRADTAPKSGP